MAAVGERMSKPYVTRVHFQHDFAVKGDGNIHALDTDVVVTLYGRIVGVEREVVDVTTFGDEDKEYMPTGVQTVTLIPLSAKLEVLK